MIVSLILNSWNWISSW